jgi:ABC-type Fe3+-hydroxamate transport system substrate-binding protein
VDAMALRGCIALLLLTVAACSARAPSPDGGALRIVSLAPAVTESLFAIGAGPLVVGVSDYCEQPVEATRLPRAGTILTPNYEAIAKLRPTHLVGEKVLQYPHQALFALAPVVAMPWLTVGQVASGIRELGRLTSRTEQAEAIATRIERTLSAPAPADAPRVLAVLSDSPQLSTLWYVKKDSLHGAVLEAAGARNAAEHRRDQAPQLSLENVVQLNPDAVLIFTSKKLSPEEREVFLREWRKLTVLDAVKSDAIRLLDGPELMSVGPSILKLVERVREVMATLPKAKR